MLLPPESDMFAAAERRLFAHYAVTAQRRRLRLADPSLTVAVHEAGAGAPVLFVHGSGMSGATWAPVLAQLPDRRALALDLAGFGGSDAYRYSGRPLRAHAVAQLESALDALGLERAALVGTSMGALWVLSLALERPERVRSVTAIGMPAVALPGLRADPFFRLLTTPGIGRLVVRAPAPKTVRATRKAMAAVLGERALDRTPDVYFELVRQGMKNPGWGVAMRSHLALAMRAGRARPGERLQRRRAAFDRGARPADLGRGRPLRRPVDRTRGGAPVARRAARGARGRPRAVPRRPRALRPAHPPSDLRETDHAP